MLTPDLDAVRLVVHLLAASVWVGGQIVLAGIVPTVRRTAPEALPQLARGFAMVAWPAFALAVVTGLWILVDTSVADTSSDYQATLLLKILVVMFSGTGAFVHQIARTKAAVAAGAALGLGFGLIAMLLGVLLAGG